MEIGLHKDGTRHFVLTEKEYIKLVTGEPIVKFIESYAWKKAKFIITFEGKSRF